MRNIQIHKNLKSASYIILAAVCAGFFKILTVYGSSEFTEFSAYIGLALNMLIMASFIWLALQISEGKNWARVLFVVLAGCMLVFAPFFILIESQTSTVIALFSTVFSAGLLLASILLYTKETRQWFSERLQSER